MRRGVWFMAGAVSGVYTLLKAKRTVNEFTPDGIAARMAALGAGARVFADEVSAGMQEREAELRADIQAQHAQHDVRRSIGSTAHLPGLTSSAPQPREGMDDGNR